MGGFSLFFFFSLVFLVNFFSNMLNKVKKYIPVSIEKKERKKEKQEKKKEKITPA